MRNWVRSVAVFGAVLALAGCAGGASEQPAAAPEGGPFPVTITDSLGTATIPAEPERIVALSGEEDTLALLGITPVAFSEGYNLPGRATPWAEGQPALAGAAILPNTQGQTEVNVEQIAALEPDLILATNLYGLGDVYPRLSGIAPTVGFPGTAAGTATWQQLSLLVGKAVGREADAAAAVARTESQVKDLAAALPGLSGKTFTSSYYYQPGTFATIDSPDTGAAALLSSLGMQLSPRVSAEVKDRTVSMEQIGVLDADFVSIGFAGDALKADLNASPLYTALPAARAGHVLEVSEQLAAATNNPSILNVPWQLAQFRPMLEKVAAG